MANYTVGYKQPSKKKVYNTVYNNSAMYIVWLDEIKRDGVDNEGRVLEFKPKNFKIKKYKDSWLLLESLKGSLMLKACLRRPLYISAV